MIHSPAAHQRLSSTGFQASPSASSAFLPMRSFGGKNSSSEGMKLTRITKLMQTPAAEKMPNIRIGISSLIASVASPMAVVPVASDSGSSAWCTDRSTAPAVSPVSAIWSR